jgi:hypothetical protein
MQHKERLGTNERAIHIVLLTVFGVRRPSKSFPCSWHPLLTTNVPASLPAQQGPSPRTSQTRRAQPSAPLTHATTRAQCFVRHAQCVFCGNPDRPLAVGTPPPRVNPRCSTSQLHVLFLGPHQSSDAEISREERASSHMNKVGPF